MWITVENKRVSGDFLLGISQLLLKGFIFTALFPQLSPQIIISCFHKFSYLIREKICNYKMVILLTHILTAVITTNYLNKTLLSRVP
jgi:hypothetical protein